MKLTLKLAVTISILSSIIPTLVAADDPPIILPPITVIGYPIATPTVSIFICSGLSCSGVFSSDYHEVLSDHAEPPVEPGDNPEVRVPIRDIPDNPNNGEPDANCSSIEGVRINHAGADLAPLFTSGVLDHGDLVRISYSNGETEIFVFDSYYSSVVATPVPGTCGP